MAVIGQGQLQRSTAAAARVGAWLTRIAGFGRRHRPGEGRWLIAGTEFVLVLLIAVLLARLFWTIFEPLPPIEEPAPRPTNRAIAINVGNPFRTAGVPSAVDDAPRAVDTSLNLALHGTWVDQKRASAVISTPDGEQKTYFVGDAVCCGATLVDVFREEAIISRGGVRESLRLPKDESSAAPPLRSAPAVPADAAGGAAGSSLTDIVRIDPKLDANGLAEVRLHPGAHAAAFAKLGFHDGDKLLDINNQPLPSSPSELAETIQSLQGQDQVAVTVERNGVRIPLTVSLGGE